MEELIRQSGMGVESIDFSIADNLDHFSESIDVYREKLKKIVVPVILIALAVSGTYLMLTNKAYSEAGTAVR